MDSIAAAVAVATVNDICLTLPSLLLQLNPTAMMPRMMQGNSATTVVVVVVDFVAVVVGCNWLKKIFLTYH